MNYQPTPELQKWWTANYAKMRNDSSFTKATIVWNAATAAASAAAPQVVADERVFTEAMSKAMDDASMAGSYTGINNSRLPINRAMFRAALAAAPMQAQEPVLQMLLDIALHAYNAMDNTEENENGLQWYKPDFDALSAAMDKLDALPDDRPGYVMGPAAKAEWALRHRAPVQPVAVPGGSREEFEKCLYSFGQRVAQDVYKDIVGRTMDISGDKTRHVVKEVMADIVGKGLIEDLIAAAPAAQGDAKDAERYRWLRDKSEPGICAFYLSVGKAFDGVKFNQATVDEAIDAQIAAIAAKAAS